MAEMKEPSSVIREHHTLLQVSNSHGLQLLGVLRSFREQGLLFDFTIKVQERSFPCHRCVLAACSDFFRAMFEAAMRERDDGSVTLCNQFPVVVESFLDFAYSGEILITEENVDSLFQLASFLQVNVLEECLRSDALCVPSEEAAVMSLLRWICQDIPGRQKLLPKLLSLTRLHHLPPHALQTLHESDLLSDNNSCMALISVAESRQSQHSGLFTDARPATTQSYIYIHKTEENGVVHHSFCYCLETDQWKELEMGQGQGMSTVPDPPGSHLTGYAEKMFVTGGCRGNCCRAVRIHVAEPFHDATDEVWCFSPVTRTCTPAPAMLKPRTMHTAVVCLERVYVIGGRTEGSRGASPSLLEVEYYDPLVKSWFSVSPLPTAIFYPEASVCGSIIYTLGSEMEITDSFNPSLDCFFSYDAQQDQWCRLVVEFCQFFHATLVKAMSVNETLHLCDLSTYKVYSFCPQTCVWKGEGSFECAGFNAGAVGIRDKIYILGGDYSPDEITDEVQVYHSDRSQWEEVAPMPRGLTEFHCQVISFNKHTNPWSDIE
ncbi:kelch repeat and BTB domain-containing protein 3 isoform X2 [Phyllopteryx taeniolatus]|uniref:kelch repeat and BTB domain-containing protein 3 isoform X2 n=1 Tax=Phyllopteryx taeniolatus TaxID=161469 RepID=UPI002AD29ED4|nr:kelch repeat and BTB domain-containing protein 3 isoform X2 [Phyllopteryx taeniolatus]